MATITTADRVAAIEAKIEKLNNTIARHQKTLEKRQAKLAAATNEHDHYWAQCDVEDSISAIKANMDKIEDEKVKLAAAQEKLALENNRINAIPTVFKDFMNNITEQWDAYDRDKYAKIAELSWSEAHAAQISYTEWYEATHITDEEIHKANYRTARVLIENLIDRVTKKTGNITDCGQLYVRNGNSNEGIAINGLVKGDKGNAHVETICAGGYNIQRFHYRILVK